MTLLIRTTPPLRPRAVLFDLDDTLYPYRPCNEAALNGVLDAVRERFNLHPDAVREAFEAARLKVKERVGPVAARHSRLLYFHAMLEGLGLGSQVEEALRLEQMFWRDHLLRMRLFPGAADFLALLRSFGIPQAIVTDLTAQVQFRKLAILGISGLFDAVVASEEAAGEKETGAPYALVMEKLGLGLGDPVWMIGDSDADIAASRRFLGAATFRFTGQGGASHGAEADVTFDDYEKLTGAVDGWLGDAEGIGEGFRPVRSGTGLRSGTGG